MRLSSVRAPAKRTLGCDADFELGPDQRDFPALVDFYEAGATDYLSLAFAFGEAGDPRRRSRGRPSPIPWRSTWRGATSDVFASQPRDHPARGRSAATLTSNANEGARRFHQGIARRSPLARRTPVFPDEIMRRDLRSRVGQPVERRFAGWHAGVMKDEAARPSIAPPLAAIERGEKAGRERAVGDGDRHLLPWRGRRETPVLRWGLPGRDAYSGSAAIPLR